VTKNELLQSLTDRKQTFQDMSTSGTMMYVEDVIKLIADIQREVRSLEVPRLYLSDQDGLTIGIATVPDNTPTDDWDKHSVVVRPIALTNQALETKMTHIRNVLVEAGIDVIWEA
jgi:hypothetical protein